MATKIKMTTAERTARVIRELKDCMKYWEMQKEIKLCISSGNMKIGRVMNVSLAPIITCGNCKECAGICYDTKACLQYENVRNARAKNTVLMRRNRHEYFRQIREAIKRRRSNFYFRWHVSGEIPDVEYFDEMVQIARENPAWVFWTYTKMYWIVNAWVKDHGDSIDAIPANLHVMFSEWDGLPMPNPYGFPEFSCRLKGGNKNHSDDYFHGLHKCPGNCDICKALHRGCVAGETSYADEH